MHDATEGQRLYAIGDVHGCAEKLRGVLEAIGRDLERRPHPQPRLVLLGDYGDRGPDTQGVIDTLVALEKGPLRATFLLGNHDAMLLDFLQSPDAGSASLSWLDPRLGGGATLVSYGVAPELIASPSRAQVAFADALPSGHRGFLERCRLSLRVGSYFFVHAGVRPGVGLDAQDRQDMLWIRDPFLRSSADFGAKVVHGHTIVEAVEHHPNRIALDTGAVRGGTLSCAVLEGPEVALLAPEGPRPLPLGAGLPRSRAWAMRERLWGLRRGS